MTKGRGAPPGGDDRPILPTLIPMDAMRMWMVIGGGMSRADQVGGRGGVGGGVGGFSGHAISSSGGGGIRVIGFLGNLGFIQEDRLNVHGNLTSSGDIDRTFGQSHPPQKVL